MRTVSSIVRLVVAIALSGCDPAPQWTSGNYEVYSISGPNDLKFGVDVGGGTQGLVEPQVVGIGEDAHWIVVKQHSNGDRIRTGYYYLRKRTRENQLKGLDAVQGPFSDAQFYQKTNELKLPPISITF
jgi:hypothetical protein